MRIKKEKIIFASVLLFFFGLVPGKIFGATFSWSDISGEKGKNGLVSDKKGAETKIAVSKTGKVFVAFEDKREWAFAKQFNGRSWVNLSSGSKVDYVAANGDKPDLTTKGEEVYIAFKDLNAGKRARVQKWDGSSWLDVADAGHPQGYISSLEGFEPVLSFDKSGQNLYVAFRDEASGERIKVMKWNESSGWQAVADANNVEGLVSISAASEVDVKASKIDDSMYIAYEDLAAGGRVRARKWDGASWQDLSDESHPEGLPGLASGYSPSIDTDDWGNLYLVYTGRNEKNTYIHKWNGSHWEDVGGGVAVRGKTIESTIAVDARGYLYLAYSQKAKGAWRVRGKVWTGARWIDMRDGKSQNISKGRGKGDPSLATFENRLYMSFTDARNKNKARVKMLNFAP